MAKSMGKMEIDSDDISIFFHIMRKTVTLVAIIFQTSDKIAILLEKC
ncbi:MAG: hypothetical protein SO170_04765 [Butyribacter sp.]|nr:hypothetical protein [bacterium]MDY3854259.1 hypothetical protein [Butyribacter sp.]